MVEKDLYVFCPYCRGDLAEDRFQEGYCDDPICIEDHQREKVERAFGGKYPDPEDILRLLND